MSVSVHVPNGMMLSAPGVAKTTSYSSSSTPPATSNVVTQKIQGFLVQIVTYVILSLLLIAVCWCIGWWIENKYGDKPPKAQANTRQRQQSLIIRHLQHGLQSCNIHVSESAIKRMLENSPVDLFNDEKSLFSAFLEQQGGAQRGMRLRRNDPPPMGFMIASWMYSNSSATESAQLEAATRASLNHSSQEIKLPPTPLKLDRTADLTLAEKFDEGEPFSVQLEKFNCRRATIARMTMEQRQCAVASLNGGTPMCPFMLENVMEADKVKPEITILFQNGHVFYFDETSILKWYTTKRFNPTNRVPFALEDLWLLTDSAAASATATTESV